MSVGLVIVTFNAERHIVRCLEAVRRQTRVPDRLIIVDSAAAIAR
jgi:GT2 family glycosyltransferase